MALPLAALGLIKYIPDVIDIFSSKEEKAKKTIDVVSNIAKEVSGTNSIQEAEKIFSDNPEKAYEFKLAVMENETVLERMDELSRKRASEQYGISNQQADKMAENIDKKNIKYIFGLILLQVVFVSGILYFKVDNPALVSIVSTLVGGSITALQSERQQVYSFYFGSSLGSKLKNFIKGSKE